MATPGRPPPNGGFVCRWGIAKIAIFDQYMASSCVVNGATAICYTHICAGPWQVGDTHQSLVAVSGVVCCSQETDDEVFMTRSLNVIRRRQQTRS